MVRIPKIQKTAFDEFIKCCRHFLIMPELESIMNGRVEQILNQLMDFSSADNAQESLRIFLQKEKDFLGIILNMAGLPQEKFLRILSAERFARGDYESEWGISKVYKKIQQDDAFADKVANLLLEGRDSKLLAKKVADFYLAQLSLSENWLSALRDADYIGRIVRQKLFGEYNDLKGEYFERKINRMLAEAGISQEKGQVELVGKEVDHAIPSLSEAEVMIMTAYFETTSSSQTARANEQRDMYLKIQDRNHRYPGRKPLLFINIVDGGGWLARRGDLRKLHESCDYCLNDSMLAQLPVIIKQHLTA